MKVLKKIYPEPIGFFIQNNIDCINRIISSHGSHTYNIDFNLDFFLHILHQLRSATIVFSKNICSLSDVYPIIVAVIEQYQELKLIYQEETHQQIINALIHNKKYYTFTSLQQSLILLAYVLTPQGRSDVFKSENGYIPENEEKYVSFEPMKLPDILSKKCSENEKEEVNIDAVIDIIAEELTQQNDVFQSELIFEMFNNNCFLRVGEIQGDSILKKFF